MRVEIEEPCREIVGGVRQVLRRPAEHRRGSAQNEGRRRADAKAAHCRHAVAFRQRGEGTVEPAAAGKPRCGIAAFEDILAVEMRAVAIRACDRVNDGRLLLIIEPLNDRHGRIKREERIEREGRMIAGERERQRAMQRLVIRIANRRDGRQPVERAT